MAQSMEHVAKNGILIKKLKFIAQILTYFMQIHFNIAESQDSSH